MDDIWGPWIEHDGKGCPCVGKYVHVVFRDNSEIMAIAGSECRAENVNPNKDWRSAWIWSLRDREVIRYRIRKPRGMVILEALLQDLPQDVDA